MGQAPVLFVVGPPRSGTTILGEVLDHHPRLTHWYEPYFVWDRRFRNAPDDVRTAKDARPEVIAEVQSAFAGFRRAMKADFVVDKSPRNSLRLPFIHAAFPHAKFLFILRDARETVLSINREWRIRQDTVTNPDAQKRLGGGLSMLRYMLGRQPLWRHRLRFLKFEMGPMSQWTRGQILSRTRWHGNVGWGPQFTGWDRLFGKVDTLEFNAWQWLHCVQGIESYLPNIPSAQQHTIRYEEFTANPDKILGQMLSFLDMEFPPDFMERIPRIRAGNTSKWRERFSAEDLALIGPIVSRHLIKLGYEHDDQWHHQ